MKRRIWIFLENMKTHETINDDTNNILNIRYYDRSEKHRVGGNWKFNHHISHTVKKNKHFLIGPFKREIDFSKVIFYRSAAIK